MTATFHSLKDHFLLAMPSLSEGIFAGSLTYLCEHTEAGAMGLIVNQPLNLSLRDIFAHLEIDDVRVSGDEPVLTGGPVATERGFILHRGCERAWDATLRVTDEISLTTSRDILEALAHGDGPEDHLMALGYAGWSAGQLEEEISANAWLTIPANSDILFRTPIPQRLSAAAAQLGVDLNLISTAVGHA
ncbi:MAG: YqgE/AlgH family protein [Spongiibacteraceae bacterium]|jgi:putative transcriptional regulator|nr:YqgE/AlgH family protein [Spongiibacteraceae bacterium]